MDVRELITQLLEHNLEANVEVRIETTEEDDDFEFEIEESSWSSRNYVCFTAKPKGYVLVTKNEFEEMQKQIAELQSKLDEIEEI